MATSIRLPSVTTIRNLISAYYIWTNIILASYRHIRARGVKGTGTEIYLTFQQFIVSLLLRLPSSQAKVKAELSALRSTLTDKLAPPRPHLNRNLRLPASGLTKDVLMAELEKYAALGSSESVKNGKSGEDWKEGRVSGAVYSGQKDDEEISVLAFEKFVVSNPLHPDIFPSIRIMEAEIVAMVLDMFRNPDGAGTTTSGGTESILLACKTYRDWALNVKGITKPEMIVPASAHAAFWKASSYFHIKLHSIPVDEKTRKVRLDLVKRAINPNTIMLVGSAPNFPDGMIDDIPGLGKLATKYKLGLHVDCCLGSFIVPFLERAGFKTEPFDFTVPGVTSISCDTHKYGFAPKGTSVIMWRNNEWRSHQFYVLPGWKGGLYASPTLAGSRPGALIAGCWAIMMSRGINGYTESCKKILTTATIIKQAFVSSSILSRDLYVLGDPISSVVAFTSKSDEVNIMLVGDRMGKKGWHLNALEGPAALHIACTLLTNADGLIKDLESVVQEVRTAPKDEKDGTMVALYGLGQSSVGSTIVPEVAKIFLETLYLA
ncbi:plp-dependent transferase [Phaffia rhodozyma]|uniref:sphinganine-1-phosphate aldolase n=1 Tax=Phaffia rhodozyma TaxID=264483 RepID=A0A0F7SN48_PHARH|nr:plp-dependent transferase [Phaffia rhodozyma]